MWWFRNAIYMPCFLEVAEIGMLMGVHKVELSWANRVLCPTQHSIGHFGDMTFQAGDCTATDNQKQWNKITHRKHKKTNTEKLAVAETNIKLQNPGLIVFYNPAARHRAKVEEQSLGD